MNKQLTLCILTLLTFKLSGMDLQKKIAEQEVSALDLGLAMLHTSPKLKPQFPKGCSNLKVCTTNHMPEYDTAEYYKFVSMQKKNNK